MTKHYCPRCNKETEFEYYDGCLGYESFVCSICNFDVNDITIADLDRLFNASVIKDKFEVYNSSV